MEIFGQDHFFPEHALFQPVEEAFPVFAPHEDHGEAPDPFGLDQRQGLEKLVEGTETAGKDDIGQGVLDEHDLADEEILVIDVDIGVGIGFLFKGQADVHAHGLAAPFGGPFVGGLHDPRAAPGDDAEAFLGQEPGQNHRFFVIGLPRLDPGRAKDAHRMIDPRQGLDGIDKLRHDAEDPPRLLNRQGIDEILFFFQSL